MKVIKNRLDRVRAEKVSKFHLICGVIKAPFYWMLACLYKTPGLDFQKEIFILAFKRLLLGKLSLRYFVRIVFFSIDSFRYFEFGTLSAMLGTKPAFGKYLDVSSPRLFPLMVLTKNPYLKGYLINPDKSDLEATRSLSDVFGVSERIQFLDQMLEEVGLGEGQFDLITSISVIEHFPDDNDTTALKKIWRLLKPGGKLLVSVPCAANAFEEFIDFNEYGLLKKDAEGFVFGQRFYDESLLDSRIFSVTGRPTSCFVYGELRADSFIKNRQNRNNNPKYPFWREPLMMGLEYRAYEAVSELPNLGVIVMEFKKDEDCSN